MTDVFAGDGTAVASVGIAAVRGEHDFARAFRKVDGEHRQRKRGERIAEIFQNLESALHARGEVRNTLNRVDMEQIVRLHPQRGETFEEMPQRFGVVIYTFQKHGLVENGDPVRDKTFQRGFRIGRQFIGMIEVCDEPQSVNDGQTFRQFSRDARRFDGGSTGADPNRSDVSGIADARGDFDDAVVVHHQRVAAAQKNVIDFGVAVEPRADGIEVFIGEREM